MQVSDTSWDTGFPPPFSSSWPWSVSVVLHLKHYLIRLALALVHDRHFYHLSYPSMEKGQKLNGTPCPLVPETTNRPEEALLPIGSRVGVSEAPTQIEASRILCIPFHVALRSFSNQPLRVWASVILSTLPIPLRWTLRALSIFLCPPCVLPKTPSHFPVEPSEKGASQGTGQPSAAWTSGERDLASDPSLGIRLGLDLSSHPFNPSSQLRAGYERARRGWEGQ